MHGPSPRLPPRAVLRAALLLLLLQVLVAAASSSSAYASLGPPPPAVAVSVSEKGMDYLASVVAPLLLKKATSFEIPSVAFDQQGFTGGLSLIECSDFAIGSTRLMPGTATRATGSISLEVSDVSAYCQGYYDFQLKSWPHWPYGTGTVEIAARADGRVSVSVHAARGGTPQVAAEGASVEIDVTSLSFSGGLSAEILNIFTGLITEGLVPGLQDSATKALRKKIDDDANEVLANLSLLVPMHFPEPYNISEVDLSLVVATSDPHPSPPAASSFSLMLHGEAYHVGDHQEARGVAPPAGLPPCDADLSSRMVQVLVHPFTLESLAGVYVAAGLSNVTVTSSMINSSVPIQLDTSTFADIAPGLADKYPGREMEIVVGIGHAPKVVVAGGALNMTVVASFAFDVVLGGSDRAPGFVVACPVQASGEASVTLSGSAVAISLSSLDCSITLVGNETGKPVDVEGLNMLVQFGVEAALQEINDRLAHGFPLPAVAGVTFRNAALGLNRGGYIAFSADAHYQAPPGRPDDAPDPFSYSVFV